MKPLLPSLPSADSAFRAPRPTAISAPRQARPAESENTRKTLAHDGSSIALPVDARRPALASPMPAARTSWPGSVVFSSPLIPPSVSSMAFRRLATLASVSPGRGIVASSTASIALFICSGETPISLAKRESRIFASASLAF